MRDRNLLDLPGFILRSTQTRNRLLPFPLSKTISLDSMSLLSCSGTDADRDFQLHSKQHFYETQILPPYTPDAHRA